MGHFKGWILLGRPDTVSYWKHDNDTEPKQEVRLARGDPQRRSALSLVAIVIYLTRALQETQTTFYLCFTLKPVGMWDKIVYYNE